MPRPAEKEKHAQWLLERARTAWDARQDLRRRRARNRDYYRGHPQEFIIDPDTGRTVSEEAYIAAQGRVPVRMNRIRPVIANLKGQFRANKTQRMAYGRNKDDNEAADMMTEALRFTHDINQTPEIDIDQFEESFLSGLFGWKTYFAWNSALQRPEVQVDPVDTSRLFWDLSLNDRRMIHLSIIGEIYDLDVEEVVARFARTKADERKIRKIYGDLQDRGWDYPVTGFQNTDNLTFYSPVDPLKCRVIEIWSYEYGWDTFVHDPEEATYERVEVPEEVIAAENALREAEGREPMNMHSRYDGHWKVYFMSPDGQMLMEPIDTPYWHNSHPYTLGFASLLDGEVWGLVEDLIDPQRLVNRLSTALDYMWSSSAKGVLMLPEGSIPDGMTPQDFAQEWTKFNGVIVYKPKAGEPKPEQITANSVPVGVLNWLTTLQQEIKESAGSSGAVFGLEPTSGTPNALYQSQIMQAQITNRDSFDTFFAARRQRDLRVVQLIAQYYDDVRWISTGGRRPDGARTVRYDPEKTKDIQFDVIVSDTVDTPAARQMMEEYLTGLLQQNRLTFKQFLQMSSNPKADLIMAIIEQTNPLLAQQQLSPENVQSLVGGMQMSAQAGDRDAQALLGQIQ